MREGEGEDDASEESLSLQNLGGLHRRLIEQHRQQPRHGESTVILIPLHHRHIVATRQMGLVFLPKTYFLGL